MSKAENLDFGFWELDRDSVKDEESKKPQDHNCHFGTVMMGCMKKQMIRGRGKGGRLC